MAKKGNGNSVVNLGAGAIREIVDINKKVKPEQVFKSNKKCMMLKQAKK